MVGVMRNNALSVFNYKLYDLSLLPHVIHNAEGVSITESLPDRIRSFYYNSNLFIFVTQIQYLN